MTYEELLALFTPQQLAAQGFTPQGEPLAQMQVSGEPYNQPQPPVASPRIGEIEKFEGFNPNAYWDYGQYSIGHGTKAQPGERIDREEARRRLVSELSGARSFVEATAPNVDPGSKDALTSLTFNAGGKWGKQGLGVAARAGDIPAMQDRIQSYNRAGGAVLPGLQNRRFAEANWIGRPVNPGGQKMTPEELQMVLLSQGAIDPTAQAGQLEKGLPGAQQDPRVAVPAAAVDTSGGGTPQPGPPATDRRQNPQQAAEGRSKWETVLGDDRTRAWLAAFGARVMQPSWGGPMGQLGSGLEAGALAYGNTGKAMEDLRLKELDREDKDLDRESREKIATANIEGRQQVAEMRGQFSLQRAAAASGVKNTAENKIFADNYTKTAAAYRAANANSAFTGTPQLSEEEIAMRAAQAAQDALAQHRAAFGKGAGTGIAGARNSEIPARGEGQGGSTVPAKSPPKAENKPGSFWDRNFPKNPEPLIAPGYGGEGAVELGKDIATSPPAEYFAREKSKNQPTRGLPLQGRETQPARAPQAVPAAPAAQAAPVAQPKPWEEYIRIPGVREAIHSNPQFVAELKARYPQYVAPIDQEIMIEEMKKKYAIDSMYGAAPQGAP